MKEAPIPAMVYVPSGFTVNSPAAVVWEDCIEDYELSLGKNLELKVSLLLGNIFFNSFKPPFPITILPKQ